MFPHGLEWQSVTLSNKRVIPFQPEWSETDPGIQLSPSSSNLTNPDDLTVAYPFIEGLDIDRKQQPQPVSLQGKVEVIAPRRLYSFDLTKKDVGQTRTNDNLSVTLLTLTNNYAEIEFNNSAPLAPEVSETPLNPLIVQARDSTGQFISRAGSINETSVQIAFYQQQLAKMQQQKSWSETLEKQLDEEQRNFEKQQARHYSKVYFNGTIETLEVSMLDFSAVTVTRKNLDLPVRRFDANTTAKSIQPLNLPVVVYDDQAAGWLKGATLSEEQLKKNVSISQSVDDPSAARIEFTHLRTFNDELLGTSFNPGESPVSFLYRRRCWQTRRADRTAARGVPDRPPARHHHLRSESVSANPGLCGGLHAAVPGHGRQENRRRPSIAQRPRAQRQRTGGGPEGISRPGLALFRQGRQRQLLEGDSIGQS